MTTRTEKIADFARQLTYDDLPPALVAKAKYAFLDCAGVMLAGSQDESGQIVTACAREAGGTPDSGVIGGGFRVPPAQAAFANGVMGHALDYDDMHGEALCHITSILVPVIFALGEPAQITGRAAITAYAAGLEIIFHIGHAFAMRTQARGVHATPLSGSMGAACVAARLLGLDQRATQMALGIAASTTAGLRGNVGSMTKAFHTGAAARNGIQAAKLAQKGFTADSQTFDSEWGYVGAFGPKHGAGEDFLDGLGKAFRGHEALEFKAYPNCGKAHAAIDATLHLIRQYNITPEQVRDVECLTSDATLRVLTYHQPKTGLEAKFSLEYSVAIALLDGDVGLAQFSDSRVADPVVQSLLRKVNYVRKEEAAGWSQENLLSAETIVVKLHDGRVLSHQAERAPNRMGGEISPETLERKYRNCAAPALSVSQTDESVMLLRELDTLDDLARLTHILSLTRPGAAAAAQLT